LGRPAPRPDFPGIPAQPATGKCAGDWGIGPKIPGRGERAIRIRKMAQKYHSFPSFSGFRVARDHIAAMGATAKFGIDTSDPVY
jgi:hypothetical protein